MDDRSQIRSTAEEETRTESAVLQYILAFHPVQTSREELLREFDQGSGDATQRDAVERAVRDLIASGLLQRNGEMVLPTRAALRFDQLLGG
ncbi:MAG TPA: hypothetical protein VNO20_05580 [Solirubrobacterales bacterium]|nr:hypothetical protein [Solirubrobacterales bacterium]